MLNTHRIALLVVLLMVRTAWAGPDKLPMELQGTWRASGELPAPEGQHSMSWMLEYTFAADGHYQMTGYPPISESGRVTVTGHQGHAYELKLFERTFMDHPDKDITYHATLSANGQVLTFHDHRFTRQQKSPQKP